MTDFFVKAIFKFVRVPFSLPVCPQVLKTLVLDLVELKVYCYTARFGLILLQIFHPSVNLPIDDDVLETHLFCVRVRVPRCCDEEGLQPWAPKSRTRTWACVVDLLERSCEHNEQVR